MLHATEAGKPRPHPVGELLAVVVHRLLPRALRDEREIQAIVVRAVKTGLINPIDPFY